MKILQLSFTIFVLFQVLAITFALKNICKHRGRQMTPGQSITDCYGIITCKSGGVIARRHACPKYFCEHRLRGNKAFDHRKPYPECCGGPICDDIYKYYMYKPHE